MSKFTPGPWVAYPNGNAWAVDSKARGAINPIVRDVGMGDANLMASSHGLLEALAVAQPAYCSAYCYKEINDHDSECYLMQEAIRRAKGKS